MIQTNDRFSYFATDVEGNVDTRGQFQDILKILQVRYVFTILLCAIFIFMDMCTFLFKKYSFCRLLSILAL